MAKIVCWQFEQAKLFKTMTSKNGSIPLHVLIALVRVSLSPNVLHTRLAIDRAYPLPSGHVHTLEEW